MEKNYKKKTGPLFLLLTAFIWGFCLSGQASGMDHMGPWSFSAARLTLGGVSLFVLSIVLDLINRKNFKNYNAIQEYKKAFLPSMICVAPILATIMCQQIGLMYTQVGKCAFITAFYIFLVPLFGLFIGKKTTIKIWIAVLFAMIGLSFITISGGINNINKGDVICLFAAISYTIYILLVDKYGENVDSIKFSMFQFLVCGIICFPVASILEPGELTIDSYMLSIVPIIVTGIISCGVGYTLQIIGQKYTDSNTSSIMLSSETIFSLVGGFIILKEMLKPNEYIGCAIMTIAIFISVMPEKSKKESK